MARKSMLLLILVALALVAASFQLFDVSHALNVGQSRGFFDG